jgi:23S rRNA (uracil1939-C5)-methyltransferase
MVAVTIEKLVYGGDGLARMDGRVVLTPFVLPGERVNVETVEEKRGLIRGRTVEVLEPAAERVAAPCPYFARCGGCHYQQAPYAQQLAVKQAILVEELRRLGKIEPPAEIATVAAEPWGYRNRTQLHIAGGRIGYWEARSRKLCAIEQCPISSPMINRAIATLNEMVRDRRWPSFLRSVELFTDERQVQLNVIETERPVARRFFDWCAEQIEGYVEGALDYEGRFRVGSHSFFQTNRFLLDRLVETAVEGARGETALDLYSGVGLFSLAMAPHFARVVAVESGNAAVRDLMFNEPELRVFVLTHTGAVRTVRNRVASKPWIEVIDAGEPVSFRRAFRCLHSRGIEVMSCVGGRRTATALLDEHLVSDIYLTTSATDGGDPNTPYHEGSPLSLQRTVLQEGRGTERGVTFEHFRIPAP